MPSGRVPMKIATFFILKRFLVDERIGEARYLSILPLSLVATMISLQTGHDNPSGVYKNWIRGER